LYILFSLCQSEHFFVLRKIHVLWAWKGLQRPVDEAVEEDEAGTASPDEQDNDEGGTQIIDHLQAGTQSQNKNLILENQ